MTVTKRLKIRLEKIVVFIAFFKLGKFFAPKNCDITTCAPIASPLKKLITVFTKCEVEPIAASA